jgi:hypothetical protein
MEMLVDGSTGPLGSTRPPRMHTDHPTTADRSDGPGIDPEVDNRAAPNEPLE